MKPDKVSSSIGLLFINGGSHRTNPPSKAEDNIVLVAKSTETVVASLGNVPNQPTLFAGETKGRTEDSLIAYTWDKFLRTGDEKWPARLPMTKAAVRALDTMTAFYELHLPSAKRVPERQEVRFTTQGGTVRLARLDKGTRITLVVGPR